MHPAYYFCFLLISSVELYCLGQPGWTSYAPIAIIFVGIPVIDFLMGLDRRNPTADQEKSWSSNTHWMPAAYTYVATHFLVLATGLYLVRDRDWIFVIGSAISVGVYTGGLGITVAHEFAHKRDRISQFVANLILVSVWYQHFFVEHVRGHHLNVASPQDPASAPTGMSSYRFLVRSLWGSYLHALELEKHRLGRTWDLRNQVLQGNFVSLLITFTVATWGMKALAFFLVQSFVAVTLLELVNYVEHYGLQREMLANGRYERVRPHHSWNSSHGFSNALLFNLQRHSDHHACAHLPYTALKHHEDVPQLPSGYTGVLLLSACPPLWFKVMNPRLEKWKESRENQTENAAAAEG